MDTSKTKDLVKILYHDSAGQPIELTPGQLEIFDLIAMRGDVPFAKNHIDRAQFETTTRFGKSLAVGLALLTRCATFPEKWVIAAGNKEKAQIIMSYVNTHIFDNDYTKLKFIRQKNETEESIREHKSKSHITFNLGRDKSTGKKLFSELFITTGAQAMGFGSANVVEDESGLISNSDHAKIMRMLGDHKDNFLVKIGNPFFRVDEETLEPHHFFKSSTDPKYYKVWINYQRAIKEGRLTQEYVNEMKQFAFFDVFYEVLFPAENAVSLKDWIPLLLESEVRDAMVGGAHFGTLKAGCDVADTGLNSSVIIKRSAAYAEIVFADDKIDPTNFAAVIGECTERDEDHPQKIISGQIYVDRVGVGAGVVPYLKKEGVVAFGINAGEGVSDKKFLNLRAQMYWRLRDWIKGGGRLSNDPRWLQLCKIYYKADRFGRLQIMPKDVMMKLGIPSPDIADGLSLTFTTPDIIEREHDEEKFFQEKMRHKKIKKPSAVKAVDGYYLK